MKLKTTLRIISLAMLIIAICFLAVALTHPELGTVFYIGNMAIGSQIWKVFYIFYLAIMASFFVASFFIKSKKQDK